MTEYLNHVTNPAAPWSFISDTEENILHDLECYTLDPVFEFTGTSSTRRRNGYPMKRPPNTPDAQPFSGTFSPSPTPSGLSQTTPA